MLTHARPYGYKPCSSHTGWKIAVKINQINFSYIAVEDRLLFRFNTQDRTEFRMWLTRAKSLKMLYLLNQAMKMNLSQQKIDFGQPAIQAVMDFRRDAVLAEADFKTAFATGAVSLPLGEQPVLMSDVGLDSSQEVPTLTFQLAIGQNVSLSIDYELGLMIGNLLSEVLCKTDWGVEVVGDSAIKTLGSTGAVMLH